MCPFVWMNNYILECILLHLASNSNLICGRKFIVVLLWHTIFLVELYFYDMWVSCGIVLLWWCQILWYLLSMTCEFHEDYTSKIILLWILVFVWHYISMDPSFLWDNTSVDMRYPRHHLFCAYASFYLCGMWHLNIDTWKNYWRICGQNYGRVWVADGGMTWHLDYW